MGAQEQDVVVPDAGRGPTLEDVARASGVSRATASRVVRGDANVSADKIALVEQAVSELGYVPNVAARSLASRQTGAVALVVPEPEAFVFSDPFLGAAVSGVAAALTVAQKQLMLLMSSGRAEDDRLRTFLRGGHADGFVVMSHHEGDIAQQLASDTKVPMVFIGRPSGGRDVPYVDLDNLAGGRMAARRLIERGCRRIAIICGPQDMAAAIDRRLGFEKELADAGLAPAALRFGDFTIASGERETASMLREGLEFDAIFASSDLMALGAMKKLEAEGLHVPEDVAIVGFDDVISASDDTIALTTIVNPGRELARRATELLIDLLHERDVERAITLTPQLTVRRTA
ncbi:LacI family DNA-binding transcriptional regulator [Brachybacterium sp. DNPG3]